MLPLSKNSTVAMFPVPVGTPITDPGTVNMFGAIWQRFFKAFSDTLLKQTFPINSPDNPAFKYVLVGCIVTCNYYVTIEPTADPVITLPYQALLAFEVDSTVYLPATKQITISKTTTFLQFSYVASLQN
jgi:hypothetical protein